MRAKKTAGSKQKSEVRDRKRKLLPKIPPEKGGGQKDSIPCQKRVADSKSVAIHGSVNSQRVPSRILEEQIQQAVKDGARELHIIADGQHGLGGRIWPRGEAVKITIEGPGRTEARKHGNVRHRDSS